MIGTVAAWLAGAVGAGGATELALRAWFRRTTPWLIRRPGARLLVRPDPAASSVLEAEIRHRYNAWGFRGPAIDEAPRGTRRVLVTGGSHVECFLLDQASAWPLRLGADLATRLGTPVESASAGLAGARLRDVAEVLERGVTTAQRWDLIVVSAGASDLNQWLNLGAPPDLPDLAGPLDNIFDRHPERRFGWSPRRTALAEALRRARDLTEGERVIDQAGRYLLRARAMRAAATPVPVPPSPERMFAQLETGLRRALRVARSRAPAVAFVPQVWFDRPAYDADDLAICWMGGLGNASMPGAKVDRFLTTDAFGALMRRVNEVATQVARAEGVLVIDVRDRFVVRRERFFDELHLSAEGAREFAALVADGLADALRPAWTGGAAQRSP